MVSYLRRYLTLMVFNISVADEDNDGQSSKPCMTEEEVVILRTKLQEHFAAGMGNGLSVEAMEKRFTEWLAKEQRTPDVRELEGIQSSLFPRAVKTLDDKMRKHLFEQKADSAKKGAS